MAMASLGRRFALLVGFAGLLGGPASAQADASLQNPAPTRVRASLEGSVAHVSARFVVSVHRGSKRMLVFSDERLPVRVRNAIGSLYGAVPAGTIVHTIALSEATGELERADDAALAPVAAATTGIAVSGVLDETGRVDATILARPIALDHVKVRAPGWHALANATSTCRDDESIREGSSCTWWGEGTASSGDVVVEGLVWNRALSRTVRPDPARARTLARTLSALGGFSDGVQREIDRLAGALNDVWSLFGTWGGTAGYADLPSGGGTGWGTICDCGTPATIGHGSGTGSGTRTDFSELIRTQLADAVTGCHPDGARVGLVVETTLEEIVSVEVSITPAAAAVHDCILEAVWNVPLKLRRAPSHATTSLAYMQ